MEGEWEWFEYRVFGGSVVGGVEDVGRRWFRGVGKGSWRDKGRYWW